MITADQIQSVQERIAQEFTEQCAHGLQSKELPSEMMACGQFLDTISTQRGLHGTAAAIRVLAADTNSNSQGIVQKLIQYLQDRRSVEINLRGQEFEIHLNSDESNIIKISEILYGLAFVPHATSPTDTLISDLRTKLLNGQVDNRGWGYVLGASEPQLLPTAYAVRGLMSHGYNCRECSEFLIKVLEDPQHTPKAFSADVTVHALCLFVLTFGKEFQALFDKNRLRPIFDRLWKQLEPLLTDDIEQNLEYPINGAHHYVRVPWQLYLIGMAPALRPWRAFASAPAQERISSICSEVLNDGGLLYKHSGDQLSSRTNSILYDTLEAIIRTLPGSPLWPFYNADRVRRWLNSGPVTVCMAFASFALIGYSLYIWLTKNPNITDLAPGLISSVLLFFVSLRKRR